MDARIGQPRHFARALAIIAVSMVLGFGARAEAGVQYKWVQLVPQGVVGVRAVVRVIVDAGDACPSLSLADADIQLGLTGRGKPRSGFEAIDLCEVFLEAAHTQGFSKATLSGGAGQLNIPDLSRGVPLTEVVGFGCTGCRGSGDQAQCDREHWPFAQVNERAANGTSSDLPPLVLHLGDVRYADQKSLTDYWSLEEVEGAKAGWKEEYFEATKPLLEKGMWINIRGNHEACLLPDRADQWWLQRSPDEIKNRGSAWFYFFGYDDQVTCETVFDQGDWVEPFAFDALPYLGTVDQPEWGDQPVRIAVMDTARTGDERDGERKRTKKLYTKAFDQIAEKLMAPDRPLWILSHIPIYSLNRADFTASVMLDALNDSRLESRLQQVSLALAAHRHEALLVNPAVGNPAEKGPIQYAAGHAGVALSSKSETQLACDLAKVKWEPVGKSKDSKAEWLVLRRPNHGFLKARLLGDQMHFSMDFYSLTQNQWYGDSTVNCNSDSSGRFTCPYLPTSVKAKCP